MGLNIPEKRSNFRCFFCKTENVHVILNISNTGKTIVGTLLNISEDGMGIAFTKDQARGIYPLFNSHVIKTIENIRELEILSNTVCNIRWVMDMSGLDHVGVGYQFQNITPAVRNSLDNFMNERNKDSSLDCT
jgi:hypothetical protein